MKIERITNNNTQPLYRLTALNNEQLERLERYTESELFAMVEPYNFGGQVKSRGDYSVTIQVFID
jgi:hypothetical protein